jgi:hypothetical protein
MRQAQLLLVVHAAAGRLFSVAQSGVENGNADLLRGHGFLLPFTKGMRALLICSSALWYGVDGLKQCL